ncbi:hypothetical protein [Cyclobacterium plantarum]|uniref:Lipoprotein n=1 Tax=Cyclobacterium plantarum TaxID=2716263 RepID=A0ABX0H3U3_9BACT|nr:hypothetical protein [Cyclobacterium plantarum]NHE56289.1 hypothetical protein [Cyclobacterium plantarum]
MKNRTWTIILLLALVSACTIDGEEGNPDDLKMVNQGNVVLELSDIDYYDFSTHVVYLKENNRLEGDFGQLQGANMVVNGSEVYPLKIHEPYLATMSVGPHIKSLIDVFGDFAFRISFGDFPDGAGSSIQDPRSDPRIISALKKQNKYRAGLSIDTESIIREGNQLKLKIKLRNLDNQDYYFLDPHKMGEGLFHYFSNGLEFFDPVQMKYQQNRIQHEQPESSQFWSLDWMSVIKGKESKTFEFTYPFENVPTGRDLKFSFTFPSPELSITQRSDLDQEGGRIWLGNVGTELIKRF